MRLPSGEKKSRGGAFELTRDRASFQASQALFNLPTFSYSSAHFQFCQTRVTCYNVAFFGSSAYDVIGKASCLAVNEKVFREVVTVFKRAYKRNSAY